jgi:hypothetical protein
VLSVQCPTHHGRFWLTGISVGGFGLLSGFVMARRPPVMLIFAGLYLSFIGAVVLLGAWDTEAFLVPRVPLH